MTWYMVRWICVLHKITRSTKLQGMQHSPELVLRSTDFHAPENLIFPALGSPQNFFWHLLMNLKNNYLLKKLLKWANEKWKYFNIYNILFFWKNKEKHLEILFHTRVNLDDMTYSSWDIEHGRLKVRLSSSKQVSFYLLQWKPFKSDEKCFLFHLKSSFHSQDI